MSNLTPEEIAEKWLDKWSCCDDDALTMTMTFQATAREAFAAGRAQQREADAEAIIAYPGMFDVNNAAVIDACNYLATEIRQRAKENA